MQKKTNIYKEEDVGDRHLAQDFGILFQTKLLINQLGSVCTEFYAQKRIYNLPAQIQRRGNFLFQPTERYSIYRSQNAYLELFNPNVPFQLLVLESLSTYIYGYHQVYESNFFFFLSIKICIWALGNFGILAKKFSHNMYMYMYVYTHTLFYNKGLHTLLTCEWIFLMLYNPFIIL